MKLTLKELVEAMNLGEYVSVIINGEYYELEITEDERWEILGKEN